MDSIIEEFTISLKYQVKVDTETGEMTTKCISRKIDKSNFEVTEAKRKTTKFKKEESSEPKLILEDNKYCLNTAAAELMQVNPDDKLDIKYEKHDKVMRPIIGTDAAFGTHGGNRLTKSLTVACRGSKNSELAKYGTEFTIIPHESKENLFILSSGEEDLQKELNGDENIVIDEPVDIDFSDLTDDKDVEEIDANFFKL